MVLACSGLCDLSWPESYSCLVALSLLCVLVVLDLAGVRSVLRIWVVWCSGFVCSSLGCILDVLRVCVAFWVTFYAGDARLLACCIIGH